MLCSLWMFPGEENLEGEATGELGPTREAQATHMMQGWDLGEVCLVRTAEALVEYICKTKPRMIDVRGRRFGVMAVELRY
jgi:hypothetical protein